MLKRSVIMSVDIKIVKCGTLNINYDGFQKY